MTIVVQSVLGRSQLRIQSLLSKMEADAGGRKTRGGATAKAPSRCTRSQAAPQWSAEETLILVGEIAALNEPWLKALSSYQRWKMISDNCVAVKVLRSSTQCKRRWETLLSDYTKISVWESNTEIAAAASSYWSLHPHARKQLRLPASFDRQVFDSMDAVIKAHQAPNASPAADTDSEDFVGDPDGEANANTSDDSDHLLAEANESEEAIGMPDADSGSDEIIGIKTAKKADREVEMTNKLHENAREIHAVLRGELPDKLGQRSGPVDLMKANATEPEFTARQADELIKSFGVLVDTLDQFAELIKGGECSGLSLLKPMPS